MENKNEFESEYEMYKAQYDRLMEKDGEWKVKYDELKAEYDHKVFCLEQFQQLHESDKGHYAALQQQHQQLNDQARKLADALEMIRSLCNKNDSTIWNVATSALSSWNEGKEGKV